MKIDLRDLEDKGKNDPALDDFKHCVKKFAESAKKLSNSSEGKKLPSNKWAEILKLIKKSKIAASMIELGIDDEEEFNGDKKDTSDIQTTGDGEEEGDEQSNKDSNSGKENDTSSKLAALGLKNEEKQNQPEFIKEKSTSKSQQRLFGMVHAYNKGDLKSGDVDEDLMNQIKKISKGMTKKDAKKMAKTKHDDLPEKVPTNEFYDTMNHLSILLSEQSFDNIESDGSEFFVDTENRKFTIKFDDKFYMVSEKYNFELGTKSDLQEVVNTFVKLTKHSDLELKTDYENSLS